MGVFSTEIRELAAVLDGADHVDVKSVDSELGLRQFVDGALSSRPWWVTALFGVRVLFAWMLRLDKAGPPSSARRSLLPDQIQFVPGAPVSFFTVTAAQEDTFLLLEAADTHLTGYLAFVVDPAVESVGEVAHGFPGKPRRLHVVTVVRYHRWTGPLYFTVIRPFHHLVVRNIARAGARGPRQAQNRNKPAPTAAR
jgi:hypothetical protein